jgi:hypothetical protein
LIWFTVGIPGIFIPGVSMPGIFIPGVSTPGILIPVILISGIRSPGFFGLVKFFFTVLQQGICRCCTHVQASENGVPYTLNADSISI